MLNAEWMLKDEEKCIEELKFEDGSILETSDKLQSQGIQGLNLGTEIISPNSQGGDTGGATEPADSSVVGAIIGSKTEAHLQYPIDALDKGSSNLGNDMPLRTPQEISDEAVKPEGFVSD